jgi:GNAT superfamily N-acetyltransferase
VFGRAGSPDARGDVTDVLRRHRQLLLAQPIDKVLAVDEHDVPALVHFGLEPVPEDAVRVFALGVKPEYQHTGVAARFYQMHFDATERTAQKGGEMGWILETNKPMNRAMEGMAARSSAATGCTSGCYR